LKFGVVFLVNLLKDYSQGRGEKREKERWNRLMCNVDIKERYKGD